jgi:hypothetical protein
LNRQRKPLSHHQILILHVLLEEAKGPKSPWHPYLRELPQAYPILAAWPRATAASAALQAAHAVRAHRRAVASARRDWLEAREVLRRALELSGCVDEDFSSWRRWLWALGAALSRTMHFSADDRAGCLTPFGDLLNHAAPHGAPWAPDPLEEMAGIERSDDDDDEEEKGDDDDNPATTTIAGDGALDEAAQVYVLRTRRHIPLGGEALLSYGRHTNLELLTLYGFLLPTASAPNPDDRAFLPRRHVRAAMGGGGGDDKDSDNESDDDAHQTGTYSAPLASQAGGGWYVHAADGRPCWALFEALRRRAEEEAAATAASSSSSSPLQQALLVERWLRQACLATLSELPTTAEEDEAWLRSSSSGGGAAADDAPEKTPGGEEDGDDRGGDPLNLGAECQRLAVEWRLEYKRALLRCVARCDRALAKGEAAKQEEEPKPKAPPPQPPRRGRVIALAPKAKR